MKAKHAIIPFVPAILLMTFFKLMSISHDNFMGMNKTSIKYVVIGISLGLFVICILINLFDRKTAPVYPVSKNLFAGIFAILTGFTMMASSITAASELLMLGDGTTEMKIVGAVCAVFALPAGLAMTLISRVHFAGKSNINNLSVLFVFPSLWACAELVYSFLQATKVSLYSRETDLTGLFCFIFAALFFFSNSMVISRIKGRNPVKGLFVYGLPMVSLTLSYGVYELFLGMRDKLDKKVYLFAAFFLCAGLYAISFIFEVYTNYYSKDDLEIVTGMEDDEEEVYYNEDTVETSHVAFAPVDDEPAETKGVLKKFASKVKLTNDSSGVGETAENAALVPDISGEINDLVFSERSNDDDNDDTDAAYPNDYYSTEIGMEDYILGYDYVKANEEYEESADKQNSEDNTEKGTEKPEKSEKACGARQERAEKAGERSRGKSGACGQGGRKGICCSRR